MFLHNKYTLWYFSIIDNALNRNINCYIERLVSVGDYISDFHSDVSGLTPEQGSNYRSGSFAGEAPDL